MNLYRTPPSPDRPRGDCRRGSILLAGSLFLVLFMMIAALGVDVSRYFKKTARVQQIADAAALSGAAALNQPTDQPDTALVYRRVLQYIEAHQGPRQRRQYTVYSPTNVKDIHVVRSNPGGSPPTYRVGVVAYGRFEPFFMPRFVFGSSVRQFARIAVAKVRPEQLRKLRKAWIDCGVLADDDITLSGNNFNAADTNFCSNSSVFADGSSNGVMGDVRYDSAGRFTPPGGGFDTAFPMQKARDMPRFKHRSPGAYDVPLTASYYTHQLSACQHGGKRLQTRAGTDLRWSDSGNPVCAERSHDGSYTLSENNGGMVETVSGDPVSIYADGGVRFPRNGTGLRGGLYAEGDVIVTKNNHIFDADPSVLGGLTVWSEGDVVFAKNSVSVRGILGARGDITFSSQGGGTGPDLRGLIVTHGTLDLTSNSQNADIVHDPSLYASSALSFGEWTRLTQQPTSFPRFSQARVELLPVSHP